MAARRIDEEGMVLLKNTRDALPLDVAHLKSIAVIGPCAPKAMTGGGGSSHVVPLFTVAPVDGTRGRVGVVAGAEVVQLYVGLPSMPDAPQLPAQLKRFKKLPLKPGETAHVRLTLDTRALSYWGVASHGWTIAPGAFQILVGSSSRDIRLRQQIQVRK